LRSQAIHANGALSRIIHGRVPLLGASQAVRRRYDTHGFCEAVAHCRSPFPAMNNPGYEAAAFRHPTHPADPPEISQRTGTWRLSTLAAPETAKSPVPWPVTGLSSVSRWRAVPWSSGGSIRPSLRRPLRDACREGLPSRCPPIGLPGSAAATTRLSWTTSAIARQFPDCPCRRPPTGRFPLATPDGQARGGAAKRAASRVLPR